MALAMDDLMDDLLSGGGNLVDLGKLDFGGLLSGGAPLRRDWSDVPSEDDPGFLPDPLRAAAASGIGCGGENATGTEIDPDQSPPPPLLQFHLAEQSPPPPPPPPSAESPDARKKRTRSSSARSTTAAVGEPKAKRAKRASEPQPTPAPPATPVAGAVVVTGPFRDPTAKARAAAAKEKRQACAAYLRRFIPGWRRPAGYEPPFHEKPAQWRADRAKCLQDRANRSQRVSGPRKGGQFVATGPEWISAPATVEA